MNIIAEKNSDTGCFFKIELSKKVSEVNVKIEDIEKIEGFCCSYRNEPFFMSAKIGKDISEIPLETQWLGIKHQDGQYSVYFSMAFEKFRTSFYGKDDGLYISAITGDSDVTDNNFYAYYKVRGTDFYELVGVAAKAIRDKFKTVSLKGDKKFPEFMKYFGWCTWDSFYEKVREEDVLDGLENFKAGGFVPKLLILDDGWQTVNSDFEGRGEWKLADFCANEKFGRSLSGITEKAKNEYDVKKFFVWHAVMGYWGGIDVNAPKMQKYFPRLSEAIHPDGIKTLNPERWNSENFPFGIVDKEKAYEFYNDYHKHLKSEGVDGVKIDVQSSVEAHGEKHGGRIAMVEKVRSGLEKSVCKNFDSEMINCMSCSNDIIYHTQDTNMMRSSNDFFPNLQESHSKHIFTNAVNSIWMSQFTVCDWDMFQTKHEYALYHASARAICGGPIYVSDRVDEHNFEIIKSLITDDGEILLTQETALPTEDCLFNTDKEKPYKIFSKNKYTGVVGVFSMSGEEKETSVSPKDIHGFNADRYIGYSWNKDKTFIIEKGEKTDVLLKGSESEIITFAEITDGFAVIGITDKINCGGAVDTIEKIDEGYEIHIITSGNLKIYTENPIEVYVNKTATDYIKQDNVCDIAIEKADSVVVINK